MISTGVFCILLATGSGAQVLPTHDLVEAGAVINDNSAPAFAEGNGSLDTGLVQQSGSGSTGSYLGMARAIADPVASSLLGIEAISSSQGIPGTLPVSSAAQAAWGDIAYYDGPNPPSQIRLSFGVDGLLTTNSPAYFLTMTVSSFNPVSEFPKSAPSLDAGFPGDSQQEATLSNNGIVGNSFVGWDSYTYASGSFSGSFHLDVNYDASLGGYAWGLDLFTVANANTGTSTADFLNTLSLEAVTLTDGTPIRVSFDSGLSLSAVPEPSSLMLGVIALGLTSGFVSAQRRREAV